MVSPIPSALITFGAFFSLKMLSSSHYVPASLLSSLSPSSPKPGPGPTRTVSFSRRAPFSKALCNPPYLTCPYIKSPCLTWTLSTRSESLHAHSHATWPTAFRLFSLYLWAAQYLAKSWDLSEIVESGERCGTESCSSPSPGGTRRMCRVTPLQSPPCVHCQAFV